MKKSISAEAGVLAGLTGLADDDDRFTRRMTSKRGGELSEAALALKARTLGFMVAKPWGDSELYDFILGWGERLWRVQLARWRSVHGDMKSSRSIVFTAKGRWLMVRGRLTRWWYTFLRAMR